jgi:serine/threonine-protein kinase HipA
VTEVLNIWLHDRVVGTLERRGSDLVYTPTIDSDLSVAHRGPGSWSADLSRNWFDGLLPEGDRRARLAARFQVRPDDTFGLLAEVGWECAGAVAVLPLDRTPAGGSYQQLTDDDVAERLDALPSRDLGPDSAVRMSLGGAQEKLLLARFGGDWDLPLDGAASTHILKPEPAQWPGLAFAEAWALRVAANATQASEATVSTTLGSRPVLIVTRYDRERSGNSIRRRHQEDLCQALGLPPGAKYATVPARPRDPSFARLAAVLVERAADPPAELLRLLEQVTVSIGLANADTHAKNVSLLHRQDGTVELAPLYDVVPTLAFVPGQTHVGMSIGGRFKMTEIGKGQLVAEAVSWGVPQTVATRTIERIAADLTAGVEVANDVYPAIAAAARAAALAGIYRVTLEQPSRHPSRRGPRVA